jgi:ribosomal protein S18 acetylase RimI-like enzyme
LEVTAAAEVLAAAFADLPHPWTAFTVSGDRHRERLQDLFELDLRLLALPDGTVTATVLDGAVTGLVVVIPSQQDVPAEVWTELSTRGDELAGDRAAASAEVESQLQPHRPTEPHLLLATMGVHPRHRGRGAGSMLLASVLHSASRDGLPVCLETSSPSNVALYGRHGFEVTAEVRLPEAPPVWFMRADPATEGACFVERSEGWPVSR